MNKLLKGAIAGAAGVALLLGGAGTFALWNDSTTLGTGTIEAGNLSVALDSSGAWSDQNGAITDLGTHTIVPGDVLTYTQDVRVTALGDTLTAELELADTSVTATPSALPAAQAANTALAAYLNDPLNHAVTTTTLTAVTPATTPATYVVPVGSTVVTVEVTLTFPSGALGDENAAKLGSVSLDDLAVTLNQTL